jgi:hypothetical protein
VFTRSSYPSGFSPEQTSNHLWWQHLKELLRVVSFVLSG